MRLVIPGRLPGLNEYIEANRANRQKGAAMKRQWERVVVLAARAQLKGWKARGPVEIRYLWVEKDRRRDKDNISSFGRKAVQDALVKAGVLPNDGWRDIARFTDDFAVDRDNPRVEVEILEV